MTRAVWWLRASYRTGAVVDAAMLVPMLSPRVGAVLLGLDAFEPGPAYRYAMGLGAALMLGWTCLLLWADRKPMERRDVLLLTVCPVITGLAAAGAYAVGSGLVAPAHMVPTWAMQAALVVLFLASWVGARRAERAETAGPIGD
ncbi:MAG: hypothetical protein U0807_10675 [Candidatus Binatia bacterium]